MKQLDPQEQAVLRRAIQRYAPDTTSARGLFRSFGLAESASPLAEQYERLVLAPVVAQLSSGLPVAAHSEVTP